MKVLILLLLFVLSPLHASTPEHSTAYCVGYSSTMAEVYRLKYYRKMNEYYNEVLNSKRTDNLQPEYIQSGAESVQKDKPIKVNLKSICEDGYNKVK